MALIENIIGNWIRGHSLSSGVNLDGFRADIDAQFWSSGAFASVVLSTASDRRSLVNGLLTINPEVDSLAQISDALGCAWSKTAYMDFQAASIVRYAQATVLRFITCSRSGLGVTGTLVATGAQYPVLAADFERAFGALPPLPKSLAAWASLAARRGPEGNDLAP